MKEFISFSVDAGIINRLGLELVSKSETAMAELIKNAYDADANLVQVKFIDAIIDSGGTLIIEDDGVGMTKEQLINGFMRLATADKVQNSISKIYNRPKAGRKGIGRFSTQRLGKKLEVITHTKDSVNAYKLTINWDDYESNKEIDQIKNSLEQIEKPHKECGTKLIIKDLRDKWSIADIKRVYRYIAELIQPNVLSVVEGQIIKDNKAEQFEVKFLSKNSTKNTWQTIADPQIMIFDRAIAVFSGHIDQDGYGHCSINTRKFTFSGKKKELTEILEVSNNSETKHKIAPFSNLIGSKIAFNIFYFIGGSRQEYYEGVNKMELNGIFKYLDDNGGVKLYRNGFRVTKYGNTGDDWLGIDRMNRIGQGIPLRNDRILGLVQVTDPEGKIFEEAASREGLIEKKAFIELQLFTSSAIETAFRRFVSWFRKSDEYKDANPDKKEQTTSASAQKLAENLKNATKILTSPEASEEDKIKAGIVVKQVTNKFISQTRAVVDELEMLRVLAGVGLTIAEFIHEIKQFTPSLNGYISDLLRQQISASMKNDLMQMQKVLTSFLYYTAYFDATISQNVIRELSPMDLRDVVRHFEQAVDMDIKRRNFILDKKFEGYDLITIPMHPSEWNTILQNLYSNAKKAILKSNVSQGKIYILCQKDLENVYLSFYDNGIGISAENKSKIFDAFFTTSTPTRSIENRNEIIETSGTGLGLYIIKQMIKNRNGDIQVESPLDGYNTCIRIKIPINK